MESEKWKASIIERAMRRERIADKAIENSPKPLLSSPDVVQTVDFVFSSIKPLNRIGDSGPLLLAKWKPDRSRRYLVKHAYTDCAANEFVYTKLVQAMGTKMPDVVLFQLSEGEKRNYFKTEYIIGLKYLDLEIEAPSYQQIRERAINWDDYFRFRAIYEMFCEGDSFETPLAKDGYIYRVDTTDAFILHDAQLACAGININIDGQNAKTNIKQYALSFPYHTCWEYRNFDKQLQSYIERYGNECVDPYLEPFSRIQEIPCDYIDDFLNTLCYFYPDFIGDYFKLFIAALQKKSNEYLKTRKL
jgi:hypothetical protein